MAPTPVPYPHREPVQPVPKTGLDGQGLSNTAHTGRASALPCPGHPEGTRGWTASLMRPIASCLCATDLGASAQADRQPRRCTAANGQLSTPGAATARTLERHPTRLPPFGSFEKVKPPSTCLALGVAGDPRRSRSALEEGSAAIPTADLRSCGQWIRRWISLWITMWITSRPCGTVTGPGVRVDGLYRRPDRRCY